MKDVSPCRRLVRVDKPKYVAFPCCLSPQGRRDDGGTKLLSEDLAPVAEETFDVHAKSDAEDGAAVTAAAQYAIEASKARLTAGEGAVTQRNLELNVHGLITGFMSKAGT